MKNPLSHLENWKIILASKSPRRQELLKGLDLEFEIQTMDIAEDYPVDMEYSEIPKYLAKLKASPFENKLNEKSLVITSDTIVVLNEKVIEKPKSKDQAKDFLSKLSGNKHEVHTGVALTSKDKQIVFSDITEVTFKKLTSEEIEYYVEKYSPLDKAGAYGVQEWMGYVGVEKLNGCFFNVMGLPLSKLYQALEKF